MEALSPTPLPYGLLGPALSPDGRTVLGDYGGAIRLYDLNTGVATDLATGYIPRWSPSGDRIALLDATGVKLRLIHPDGTGYTPVTRTDPGYPDESIAWSPDGQWIAIRAINEIDLIQIKTGVILPLSWSTNYHAPTWRPVGSPAALRLRQMQRARALITRSTLAQQR